VRLCCPCGFFAWKVKKILEVKIYLTLQFGCGIFKMVGPKKQGFWPKSNVLKGNHCILRIKGAPVRQKLGMILENKVVQKLKLEKMFFAKNGLLN
jgi:hypothetical protein